MSRSEQQRYAQNVDFELSRRSRLFKRFMDVDPTIKDLYPSGPDFKPKDALANVPLCSYFSEAKTKRVFVPSRNISKDVIISSSLPFGRVLESNSTSPSSLTKINDSAEEFSACSHLTQNDINYFSSKFKDSHSDFIIISSGHTNHFLLFEKLEITQTEDVVYFHTQSTDAVSKCNIITHGDEYSHLEPTSLDIGIVCVPIVCKSVDHHSTRALTFAIPFGTSCNSHSCCDVTEVITFSIPPGICDTSGICELSHDGSTPVSDLIPIAETSFRPRIGSNDSFPDFVKIRRATRKRKRVCVLCPTSLLYCDPIDTLTYSNIVSCKIFLRDRFSPSGVG